MSTTLQVVRKWGERKPIVLTVAYPEAYDLDAATVTFYLDAPDGTPRVEAGAVGIEDMSPEDDEQTVWQLSYEFGEDDLADIGTYSAEFEVDFGEGMKAYYPVGRDKLLIRVVEHPAHTP